MSSLSLYSLTGKKLPFDFYTKAQAGIKMEKETSTNPSTAPDKLDQVNVTSNSNTASALSESSSAGVLTPQYIDPNQSLVTSAQLHSVEERLQTKIVQNAGAKTGLLWCVAVLALAAGGFGSYTAFMQQQKQIQTDGSINTIQTEFLKNQQQFSSSLAKVESAEKAIDIAKQEVDKKTAELNSAVALIAELKQEHQALGVNDQNLNKLLESVQTAQAQISDKLNTIEQDLNNLKERNPEDWLLSEGLFLVNNAYQKAVFEKDVATAIWMLTKADELLVNIEKEQVIAIREAISKDLNTLKNIAQIDFRSLGFDLDSAYDNVDKLIFNGYADKQTVFQKNAAPTDDIANWKENLLTSAKEFSNRFIEIRRRDPNSVNEFLSPDQELYVRENMKTRILLAKNALVHGEKEEMQNNLNQAISLIKGYCVQENQVTKNTLDYLNKLAQSEITIATPRTLESYQAFNNFAKEHLFGRGK